MIDEPTVLILGAGASAEFGFPTGDKLRNEIIDKLHFKKYTQAEIDKGKGAYRSDLVNKLIATTGASEEVLKNFRTDFNESSQPTIDDFLIKNNKYMEIGKISIAYFILGYEKHDELYRNNAKHWLKELWVQYLNRNVNSPQDFGENKLSIITFNYDRSVEHFLHNSLKKSFDLSDNNAAVTVNKIPVIHVHGQLGFLRWQDPDTTVEFGASNDDIAILKTCAESISIINEQNDSFLYYGVANEHILNAKNIYFLGFGYHEQNMKNLNLNNLINRNRILVGTGYELEEKDANRIRQKLSFTINFSDVVCSEFIKSNDFLPVIQSARRIRASAIK